MKDDVEFKKLTKKERLAWNNLYDYFFKNVKARIGIPKSILNRKEEK